MPAKNKEWFRILESLKQDNIVLKNRLSDALKKEVGHSFVRKAEFFQQSFIDKEQILDLLRHDIAELMSGSAKEDSDQIEIQSWHYKLLKKDITRIVFEFHQMKISFEQFLLE